MRLTKCTLRATPRVIANLARYGLRRRRVYSHRHEREPSLSPNRAFGQCAKRERNAGIARRASTGRGVAGQRMDNDQRFRDLDEKMPVDGTAIAISSRVSTSVWFTH